MKTFLVKNKKPLIKWTQLPDNAFYEGKLPQGYDLAACPGEGYFIIDVDRHGDKDGFKNIPTVKWYHILLNIVSFGFYKLSYDILKELESTFHYPTRNNGMHYWFRYTGDKTLLNKPSSKSIDIRAENRGYVVFYTEGDPRDYVHLIKESSEEVNNWLENLILIR